MVTDQDVTLLSGRARDFPGAEIDTFLVPGAYSMHAALQDRELVAWIAGHGPRARRLCSVCAGTYLLAEAGLLDGRRVGTHWQHCSALRARYPAVAVEPDAIFVRDGPIWSSAGVTAELIWRWHWWRTTMTASSPCASRASTSSF